MSLGLNVQEMQKLFNIEYENTLRSRETDQALFANELIARGMAELEADKEAMYQMRWEVTVQALFSTILANNLRIEHQLENKGLR